MLNKFLDLFFFKNLKAWKKRTCPEHWFDVAPVVLSVLSAWALDSCHTTLVPRPLDGFYSWEPDRHNQDNELMGTRSENLSTLGEVEEPDLGHSTLSTGDSAFHLGLVTKVSTCSKGPLASFCHRPLMILAVRVPLLTMCMHPQMTNL